MNICILGPAHPLRGGIAAYNERLARAFQQQGHAVSLWSFSLQYPGFLFPGTTQFSSEQAPQDLAIHTAINSVNPVNWWKVGNAIRQQQYDLVIVRYWLPFMGPALGTILRRVRKHRPTRIVCIADNVVPHEHRPGDRLFTRYFMGPVDAFIVMSRQVLQDLHRFTQKPARLEPHPLYDHFGEPVSRTEARNHLRLEQEPFIFLFFGFIRAYKGLDLLLEAMQLLQQDAQDLPPFRLLVAGEFYEDRQRYEQLLQQPGLLLHTDFIPDSAVRYYLCASDVVVQPYRHATQSGVTPLAYHFEKPMIVTQVGGLPDLVPHGKVGLVCAPDPVSLAAAMKEMLQKGTGSFLPHLRDEKKKYSWEQMTSTILELAAGLPGKT